MIGTKACPFCAEDIKVAAIKCKHCRSTLDGPLDLELGTEHIALPKTPKSDTGLAPLLRAEDTPRAEVQVVLAPETPYCHLCGIDADVREVTFYSHIGMLIARRVETTTGIFCRSCMWWKFLRTTSTSLLLGWWGLISMFATPFYILWNILIYAGTLGMDRVSKDARITSPFVVEGVLGRLAEDRKHADVLSYYTLARDEGVVPFTPRSFLYALKSAEACGELELQSEITDLMASAIPMDAKVPMALFNLAKLYERAPHYLNMEKTLSRILKEYSSDPVALDAATMLQKHGANSSPYRSR